MAVCILPAVAQENGKYYRVQNKLTSRYISVIDNRGSVNLSTTDADLGALRTVKGEAFYLSDPSTIVKFESMSGGWNLKCQGTDTYSIINYAVKIGTEPERYTAYAQSGTMVKYLCDNYDLDELDNPISNVTAAAKGGNHERLLWNLLLVGTADDNYFGLEPTVSAGGSYYQTFYAGFPFTFYSTGMEAYYVKTIDNTKAAIVIEPISGGVTAETPVLIKCSSNQATDNRLNIGAGTGSASGNKLMGVYFCNTTSNPKHRNVVDYDPTTMRVLGTASDGSLAFVKSSDLQYIPANTAYITVDAGAPDELKVYTQSEYDALPTAKRGDLDGDGNVSVGDLVIMVNMILEKRDKTPEADLDGDGNVTVTDYVILVNLILTQ